MSRKTNAERNFRTHHPLIPRRLRRLGGVLPAATGLLLTAAPHAAHAFQLYNGSASGNDLEINLNITTSYSALYRVSHPSAYLVSDTYNQNGNDGDANFRHGLVGNTFEALPVLDIKDGQFGMHFSGEYFINTMYLGTNQNNQPTVNPFVAKNTDFASETRQANGNNGRLLDAFVYDSWVFGGGQQITLKAGQQTLFWGQSLFYGTNGISGGQAPIDAVAASTLVNPQTQQIYLPVGQIVATYKPNQTYTIQGYYQYQWEQYALNGVGSYFSTTDVLGPGGQRLYIPGGYLTNTKAITPRSQNGQFGLSVQAQYGDYDLGIFGLRYDAKVPTVQTIINVSSTGLNGSYYAIYPRDIWIVGASGSTTIGATNVASELSVHTHAPLDGAPNPVTTINGSAPTGLGDANGNPAYPVGNWSTALLSGIYGSPALSYDPGGITFIGEAEWVQLLGATRHKNLLVPSRSAGAVAFDAEAIPAYFGVLPNLELTFPISISYNVLGNSEVDGSMNHGTGSYSLGISATYRATWTASLSYVGYYGSIPKTMDTASTQPNADRDYINFNVQHTF